MKAIINKNKLLIELMTSFLLAYFGIVYFFSHDTNFEELAMGSETTTSVAVDSASRPLHILHLAKEEVDPVVDGWKARGSQPVILVLGNSQTHSINQIKVGDRTIVQLLWEKLHHQQDVLCISFPNANLQELFLAYSYIKMKIKVSSVVVPVFMDDFREDGIREVFFPLPIEEQFQIDDSVGAITKKINTEMASFKRTSQANTAINRNIQELYKDQTPQDITEQFINEKLDKHSLIWANRANVRGDFFNWLYRLRNTILGIKANTVRAMIPSRYETNFYALDEFLSTLQKEKVQAMIYIPPIRNDASLPYDTLQYIKFKDRVREEAVQHGFTFENFESIVPNHLWGYKAATNLTSEREIDYMHFQFEGHHILADSLAASLRRQAHGF